MVKQRDEKSFKKHQSMKGCIEVEGKNESPKKRH